MIKRHKKIIISIIFCFLFINSASNVFAEEKSCYCRPKKLEMVHLEVVKKNSDEECNAYCYEKKCEEYAFGMENAYVSVYNPAIKSSILTITATSSGKFTYKLLEAFPGFYKKGDSPDFPQLILAIYKFGIWTIGIAALFMLTIGGAMYMMSAGNNSTATSAKGIIWDSIIGLISALGAFLIFYVINPDLTKINFSSLIGVNIEEGVQGTPMGTSGKCSACQTGPCSVANLTSAFGDKAMEASSICNGESTCRSISSTVDMCADGKPFAIGLFQINVIDSATSIGCNVNGTMFTTGKTRGRCLDNEREKRGYCNKWECRVKDPNAYDECVKKLLNPEINIKVAKTLYLNNGNSWNKWGANKRSGCFFR